MKELVSLLNLRERKAVKTAATIAGFVCAAALVFAVRAQVRAGRAADRLSAAEARAGEAARSRDEARREFENWRQAAADLRDLGSTWFYNPAKGVQELRLDLGRIFEASGIVVPEIAYADLDLVKGRLRRTTAEFRMSGSYPMFRRVLEAVENHPRAIHVERVEFVDIGGAAAGVLEVRIVLAGYYLHAK